MVRRPYLTRLTLGRSAFEPPENIDQVQVPAENDSPSQEEGAYVQRYNERGYPINNESRALARRLRRAQNNVLATVGVCVGKDRDTLDSIRRRTKGNRERVQHVVSENELGLFVAAADLGLMFVFLWWTASLRSRLQTFRFYDGVPFRDILQVERRHWGIFKFNLAGMPAWVLAFSLHLFRTYLLDEIVDYFFAKLLIRTKNKKLRRLLRSLKLWLFESFSYGLYALTIPLQLFSYLQMLDLIPAKAIPGIWSLVPFTETSPIQLPLPASLTPGDLWLWAQTIVLSPVVLLLTNLKWRETLEPRIYYILRGIIPLPDNPDYLSLEASREDDLDSGAIPGIGWTKEPHKAPDLSMTSLAKSFNEWKEWVSKMFTWKKRSRNGPTKALRASACVPDRLPASEVLIEQSNQEDHQHSRASTATPDPADLFQMQEVFSNAGPDRTASPAPTPTLTSRLDSMNTPRTAPTDPLTRRRASTLTSNATFPSSRPQTPPDSPPPEHTVRVSAHHTEVDDTVTMQLEVSAPLLPPRTPVPLNNGSSATLVASPEDTTQISALEDDEVDTAIPPPIRDTRDETSMEHNRPPSSNSSTTSADDTGLNIGNDATMAPPTRHLHRVTALSNHPPDSLASHTATLISNILFLPLESLLLRSLALTYLSPQTLPTITSYFMTGTLAAPAAVNISTATVLGLHNEIRPLSAWLGGPGARVEYAGKLGLILAMQACVSSGLWIMGMGFVVWSGKRWFGWGTL